MPTSPPERPSVLAFGAHPDDIEFGCGGVIARETKAGRATHLVVCSRGEAATHGGPAPAGRRGPAGRGAARRHHRVHRAGWRRPSGTSRRSRHRPRRRATPGATACRARAEPGGEPASRSRPARPAGARRGAVGALRRRAKIVADQVSQIQQRVWVLEDRNQGKPCNDWQNQDEKNEYRKLKEQLRLLEERQKTLMKK